MDLATKVKKIKLCRILQNKCEVCGARSSDLAFWSLRGEHGKMDMSKPLDQLADDLDWHVLLCGECHSLGFNL